MKTSTLTLAAIAGSFIALAALSTPASACTKSTWVKIAGDSFAHTIKGRDCGGAMSVKFSGPAGKTGWLNMTPYLETDLAATYVDANITTKAIMQTNGLTMKATFKHQDNSGLQSQTYGTYMLKSYK